MAAPTPPPMPSTMPPPPPVPGMPAGVGAPMAAIAPPPTAGAPPASGAAARANGDPQAAHAPPDAPPGAAAAEGELPPEEGPPELPFLQQPWVQNVLPFVTSLAFHVGIITVIVAAMAVVREVKALKPNEQQIVIPEAAMANEMAGGVENPGIGGDPTRMSAQDSYEENTHPDGWAPEPGESPVAEAAGGETADSEDSLIGASATGGGFKRGEFDGPGTSGGGGSRGRLAPFGAPGGGMPGPRGKVFGNGGNARTIAFCCDSSGSMIDLFGDLKVELVKAVEGLRPIQQFSIVFFADEKAHLFEGGGLVNATPENKRKANKWLEDLTTSGTSNPIPGLQIAFKARPELMYILTDGDFPNNNEVISTVAQLNTGKRTRINTIAFGRTVDEEAGESFVKFLTTLADQNGGKFKRVTQDQLN